MNTKTRIVFFLIIGVGGIASTSKVLNGSYAFFDSLWPGLLGLMVAGWPWIELNAAKHAEKIARNEYPVHWKSWLLRAAIGLALCSLIHVFYFRVNKVIELALFGACYFGAVFNVKLNLKRGLPALYVGNPDKKRDSLMEKFFRRFGRFGGLAQQVTLLALMWLCGWIYLKSV